MRGPRLFLFIAALLITVGLTIGHAADDNPSLEDLIAKIPQVVTGDSGINKAEQQLALQLQSFGPSSVPRLVGLLDSDNEKIRTFAGYVVADLDPRANGVPRASGVGPSIVVFAANQRGLAGEPTGSGRRTNGVWP